MSTVSCNKDELFVEEKEIVKEETPGGNNEEPEEEEEPGKPDATLPCDFTLDNVEPNSTIVINCILDLEGKTVDLPANVTIDYEGGDIINGTINFSEGNTIDGNLLNSTLIIGGTKPQVKDPTFNFDPKRWGIVEGKVSDDVAWENRNILSEIFIKVKELGVNTFRIDEMDAYFKVSKDDNFPPKSRMADIFIPSDFNLIMTDNTHLRVQPNKYTDYTLLGVYDVSHVTIKGGHLHGDRDEHQYIDHGGETGHGDSSLINLEAAYDVVVDGVHMIDATGDGILVKAIGFAFNPDYNPSNKILIKNCIIDKSRRNNISIVNAHDVVVEHCEILNAGAPTGKSVGTLPMMGIDIEAYRSTDDNGNIIYYELAQNITIRNNIERGSVTTAFTVFIGDDVTIEDNETENGIGYAYATGVKIKNNKITGDGTDKYISAIGAGKADTETTYDCEISGNTIVGYNTAITLYSKDTKIFDNETEDCRRGIFVTNSNNIRNVDIYGNTFKSDRSNSAGFYAQLAALNDINIYENEIDVNGNAVHFSSVNLEAGTENNTVTVNNNFFMSSNPAKVSNSNGIILRDNN
ncbi:uronase [Flavivirga eckloniae]|uniref:Uronase n=2 Tax=Flavivirga eckloniae TaxID=1803846 RepID=A0A2K9PJM6_9FLAO|nr:uronase [Flavivirga eckloniae]